MYMSYFTIDGIEGTIKNIKPISWEERRTLNLTVEALDVTLPSNKSEQCGMWSSTDIANSTTQTLVLNIRDTDDNPPVFKLHTLSKGILRDVKVGSEIYDFRVSCIGSH